MEWRDRVWVYLDEENWDRSVRIVREMRPIASVALIGPAYWLCHGVYGLRSLQENGGVSFIVDTRLSGSPAEVYHAAAALFAHGAAGITLHPWISSEAVQQVKQAAEKSLDATQRTTVPRIFVSTRSADYQAIEESRWMIPTDREYMQRLLKIAKAAGGSGVISDDPQTLFVHSESAKHLAVPVTATSMQRGTLASSILGVLTRKAGSVLVPTSVLSRNAGDNDVDQACRQIRTQLTERRHAEL